MTIDTLSPTLALLLCIAIVAALLYIFYIKQTYRLQVSLQEMREALQAQFHIHRTQGDEQHIQHLTHLQESLQRGFSESQKNLSETLTHSSHLLTQHMQTLIKTTDQRLLDITGQVEKRLSEGFEKTTHIFADVTKRLALIDQAQQKITELSSNVVSLQDILMDKKSRGAFGEIQLNALIDNLLPNTHYTLQHTLSNGKRVDALLKLPEPTGHIVIDAKFPLESFQKMLSFERGSHDRNSARQQFKKDITKHIQDIAEKYIIAGETADGAVMFLPAEAIFAEIHSDFPELVSLAQKHKVWLVSPTTLMAILTTACSVLKDAATRKQVHLIQEHLAYLAKDFERFQQRMDQLSRHIRQANDDVEKVSTTARKLTSRFHKIEQVELESLNDEQQDSLVDA